MPDRNIDRIQDDWAARGKYPRGRNMDPRTQAMIAEMFPPVHHARPVTPSRTPGGYSTRYLDDMSDRIMGVVVDGVAMNSTEIAAELGVSPKYVGKALAHLVEVGTLRRSNASRWQKARYWRPAAAEAE